MTCTHASILKLISYRYGLGCLTKRHRYELLFRYPDEVRRAFAEGPGAGVDGLTLIVEPDRSPS